MRGLHRSMHRIRETYNRVVQAKVQRVKEAGYTSQRVEEGLPLQPMPSDVQTAANRKQVYKAISKSSEMIKFQPKKRKTRKRRLSKASKQLSIK